MKSIRIVEVGPRDGLQSIDNIIPTKQKVEYIDRLTSARLPEIEVTSFGSPKWVPQLADSFDVSNSITKDPAITYTALVPNEKGLDIAIDAHYSSISILATTSETFSKKNINCSISDGFKMLDRAKHKWLQNSLRVRGYISTVWHCPYEGDMKSEKLLPVIDKLLDLGISEISLGDTTGRATPENVERILEIIIRRFGLSYFALHFHDTFGNAENNVQVGIKMGITSYDSSAGGIGGCPYAPGSSGNISTEKLMSICESQGIETGVDKKRIMYAGDFINNVVVQGKSEHA